LRGYQKDGVVAAIREAGGEIFAITSEPQSLARNAQDDWETGFEHVGDPHQEISGQCTDRGWLSLFVSDWGEAGDGGGDFAPQASPWVSHPKGYFQPGVLALSRDSRVLYRWRCRPTRKNIGGALMRPTAPHVWTQVQAALAESANAPDVSHDDDPDFDTRSVPWPLFVTLLVANGWFLAPAGFDQRVGGVPLAVRQRNAILRVPVFIAAWVAAFTFLPLWIPALAFAGWVAKITPGVRTVNRRFQNVGPDESPA
jgi:hypothetical protein